MESVVEVPARYIGFNPGLKTALQACPASTVDYICKNLNISSEGLNKNKKVEKICKTLKNGIAIPLILKNLSEDSRITLLKILDSGGWMACREFTEMNELFAHGITFAGKSKDDNIVIIPKDLREPLLLWFDQKITYYQLKSLCNSRTYNRAWKYAGSFIKRTIDGSEISGIVGGNYGDYFTTLNLKELKATCTCKSGDDLCKHAIALGLTYIVSPESFRRKEKDVVIKKIRRLSDIPEFLDSVTLDDLVKELKKRKITQKEITRILNMNQNLFISAKRCEKIGHRYNFLNACKLACMYLIEIIGVQESSEVTKQENLNKYLKS